MKTQSLTPLVFVLGKGGVGRSVFSASLAKALAAQGKNILVVQWALRDSVGPLFGAVSVSHRTQEVYPGISTMNFSVDDAIREYFVDHLKMTLLYNLVISNKHVQKLIHAAPGIAELFFLGRVFWQVCLSKQERGWAYDHVIVDAPATGHGFSLFSIARTIAQFELSGPLAYECQRVTSLLDDREKTSAICVTLPEELPLQELVEFLPKLKTEFGRMPHSIWLNRTVGKNDFQEGTDWSTKLWKDIGNTEVEMGLKKLLGDLHKRSKYEDEFKGLIEKEYENIPVHSLLDVTLKSKRISSFSLIDEVSAQLQEQWGKL